MRTLKAQSAMEYLMTYGWAILIIAVVLGALFSLGVFSGASLLGTTCIASSGYLCSSPILHGGTLTATVGQATGATWSAATLCLVGSGVVPTTSCTNVPGANVIVSGGLVSGQTATPQFTAYVNSAGGATSLPSSVGSTFSGYIYAVYTVGSQSGLMTQIATITAKAS
ncbi:MAG: hypothetical protein ACP5K9_00810 [Candidatus Micrarchaeia archaeon]